jgi:putative ABC transport system substrate-binding protein
MTSRRSMFALALGLFAAARGARGTDGAGSKLRRVGVLLPLSRNDADSTARMDTLTRRLRELGWVEQHNLQLEIRYGAGSDDALRRYCRELAAWRPDVFVVVSNQALAILREQKVALPTLFISVSDPVGGGFVASLSHPGADITGFTNYDPATAAKWLEVLQEMVPELAHAGLLLNARIGANVALAAGVESAALPRRVATTRIDAREPAEMEEGIALLARQRHAGLIVLPYPSIVVHQRTLFESAAKHRLPAIYPFSHMARSGGLLGYGIDQLEQYRGAASYIDRILRGTKPGDLPVQQPTAYELAINLRAARELGLKPPAALLARATARFAITVMRCARYSGEACRSLFSPSGFTLMLATASGANLAASAFSISVWRKAHGPAPVTPTRTLPEPKSAT